MYIIQRPHHPTPSVKASFHIEQQHEAQNVQNGVLIKCTNKADSIQKSQSPEDDCCSENATGSIKTDNKDSNPKRQNPFFWFSNEESEQAKIIILSYTKQLEILKNRPKNSREPIKFIGKIKRTPIPYSCCAEYFNCDDYISDSDEGETNEQLFTFDEVFVYQKLYLQLGSSMPLKTIYYVITRWSTDGLPINFVRIKQRTIQYSLSELCNSDNAHTSYIYCFPVFSPQDIFEYFSSDEDKTVGYADMYSNLLVTCLPFFEKWPKDKETSPSCTQEYQYKDSAVVGCFPEDLNVSGNSGDLIEFVDDDSDDNDEIDEEDENDIFDQDDYGKESSSSYNKNEYFSHSKEYEYYQSLCSPVTPTSPNDDPLFSDNISDGEEDENQEDEDDDEDDDDDESEESSSDEDEDDEDDDNNDDNDENEYEEEEDNVDDENFKYANGNNDREKEKTEIKT